MPIAVTAEQAAIADAVAQWAKRAGTTTSVRAMESGQSAGSAHEHWPAIAELGVFSIALPEQAGGAGGTVADVAVVTEQLAAVLAPGPILTTLLAGLVLARSAGAAQHSLLSEIAAGPRPSAPRSPPAGSPPPGPPTATSGSAARRRWCSARPARPGCCSARGAATR